MRLNSILEKTIPQLGYELVDVEVTSAKIIRIFIDKVGGVNIGDCEFVSNHLSRLFLVENIEYNRLEVSSPGVERPLKTLEHFSHYIGRLVKIKTEGLVLEKKIFTGIIIAVEGNLIKLKLEDEMLVEIKFDLISSARLIFNDREVLRQAKNK